MTLGILSKDVHHKRYDSISTKSYQNDESNEPTSIDSTSPNVNDNQEEDVLFFNKGGFFMHKKYAIYAAAIVGIAWVVCAIVTLPYVNDDKTNVNDVQILSSSSDDWRYDYAFQSGMFQNLTLADAYGRTTSGDEDNPITNTGYCRYVQAQLKDDNGNWKLATYNLDQYIYTDKEGELQYADADKQPGHYTHSTKSCFLEIHENLDCYWILCPSENVKYYDVILRAETMYSGGLFGTKDKTKDTSIYIKLVNNNGSFVNHVYTNPHFVVCNCHSGRFPCPLCP